MNKEEYISSGIIELYVLGLTSPEESAAVERMAEEHEEIRTAIMENQTSMESFADLHRVTPNPGMKSRVLNAIREEKEKVTTPEPAKVLPISRTAPKVNTWKWIAAAAMILLLVSLSINGIYISKYNDSKDRYADLLASQNEMIVKNDLLRTRMEQAENDMKLLSDPSVKPIQLEGVEAHPGMKAMVYFNQQNKRAYLGNSNLPKPPSGREYQLWAIIDGKPVDMGMYDPSKVNGIKEMKVATAGNIQAFGVTLEKAGGVASPTMEQMYVLGKI